MAIWKINAIKRLFKLKKLKPNEIRNKQNVIIMPANR